MVQPKETEKDIFCNFLKNKGLSLTKQRLLILNAVYRNHDHFEAEELVEILKKQDSRVSRATVYRTLSYLEECRLIRKIDLGQGHSYFEHILGHVHHEHLCCKECGKIVEVTDPLLEERIETIANTHQFRLTNHMVQMFGICQSCAEKESSLNDRNSCYA